MQTQLKDKQAKEDKQQQDSEECFEYVKQDANERKSCRRKRFHWSGQNQKKYQSGSHTCSGWRRRNEKKRKERSNQDRRRTSSWWTYAPGNEALAKGSEEAPPSGLPGCVPDADCRPASPRWLGRQAEQPGYAQGRTPTVKMRQFPVAQREPVGCWTDPSEASEVAEGRQGSEIEDDLRR